MATIDTTESDGDPPGILLADIWADQILAPFEAILDLELPHCPILAASEGFSRAIAQQTPQLYLEDAQPLFFPAGELISKLVLLTEGDPTYRAIFLPKICSPPLGLHWPTDIGIDAFMESITLLGTPYKPFLSTIAGIQPALEAWF
jgi:hypothetical protein